MIALGPMPTPALRPPSTVVFRGAGSLSFYCRSTPEPKNNSSPAPRKWRFELDQ